jgi:hypothetical protein
VSQNGYKSLSNCLIRISRRDFVAEFNSSGLFRSSHFHHNCCCERTSIPASHTWHFNNQAGHLSGVRPIKICLFELGAAGHLTLDEQHRVQHALRAEANQRCGVAAQFADYWSAEVQEQQQLLAKKLKKRDYPSYIRLLENCDQLMAFMVLRHPLPNNEYWHLVKELWLEDVLPIVNRPFWLEVFNSPRGERYLLMSKKENAILDALSDPIRIYRGAAPKYARGMSWTLDPKLAQRFADHLEVLWHGRVFTALVPKSKVLAYFQDRDESEIVIDPRRIRYEELVSESRVPEGPILLH